MKKHVLLVAGAIALVLLIDVVSHRGYIKAAADRLEQAYQASRARRPQLF